MSHSEYTQGEINKPSIQVIERLMLVLSVLAENKDPICLTDIALQSGLHASTTHRILNDLSIGRFVERHTNGRYQLGMRFLELGNVVKARLDIRTAALPWMQKLHRMTAQTVNLSVRQGDEIVYIEHAYHEHSGIQVVRAIGGRAPLHLTSTGKLFLAKFNHDELNAYAKRTKLKGQTPNSLCNLQSLIEHLSTVSIQGYAVDNEELEPGVHCMACEILDDGGSLVAGLSLSAPENKEQAQWLPELQHTAKQISKLLGMQEKPNG